MPGTQAPVEDEGQVVGTVKDPKTGAPRFSSLNAKRLRELAEVTGGAMFHLGPTGLGDGLKQALDRLEKEEYEATFQHLRDDRFQLALIPAALLLLLEALLTNRRRRRKPRETG